MFIEFQWIRWRNFLSTGNTWTQIDLNKHNHTLIVGNNGSGKSTFLDALCYMLFGFPYRDIAKPLLNNSINAKDMIVEGQFKINNTVYRIVRGQKPSVFEIYENDVLWNQDGDSRDYQAKLDKVIRFTYESFKHIVVLGSASLVPFMQLKSKPRREIVENLCSLSTFTVMNKMLSQYQNTTDKELQAVVAEIRRIEGQISSIQAMNAKIREHTAVKKQQADEQIAAFNEQIALIETQIVDNITAIEMYDKQVTDLLAHKPKYDEYAGMEVKFNAMISEKRRQSAFFQKNDTCPSCSQAIPTELKETILASNQTKIDELTPALNNILNRMATLEGGFKRAGDLQAQKRELAEDNRVLQMKITGIKEKIQQATQTVPEQIEQSVQAEEAALAQLVAQRADLRLTQQVHEHASALLKDTGIKAAVIRKYLPIINKLVNKYLAAMDFFVNFEFNETFEETIKSRHRDQFVYNSFSEGEKQRIDLGLLFTWRDVVKLNNAMSTNLLIMDEVLDKSLDGNGAEELQKLIFDLTKNTNVFIISHRTDIISDKFNNVIRFEKLKDFSRISTD